MIMGNFVDWPRCSTPLANVTMQSMFRIVLECDAAKLSVQIAEQVVIDIAEEFAHRPWQTNVRCTWASRCVRLETQNDYDSQGLATRDEFSDALAACIAMYARVGDIRIVSITES